MAKTNYYEQAVEKINGTIEYIRVHGKSMRRKYGSKYIAISPNGIIDNDRNASELCKKLHESDQLFVLIETVDNIISPRKWILAGA